MMFDIKGQEVNIGDAVYIAYGDSLREAIFIKETKTTFIIKLHTKSRGISISKYITVENPLFDWIAYKAVKYNSAIYTVPMRFTVDVSQEPCKRIIKC